MCPSKGSGTLGSVILLLFLLYRLREEAVLQAGLEVVHQSPLEVLDAAWLSQDVALIWVQLQRVVGFYLHQAAQKLSAVLEMYLRFVTTDKQTRAHVHLR